MVALFHSTFVVVHGQAESVYELLVWCCWPSCNAETTTLTENFYTTKKSQFTNMTRDGLGLGHIIFASWFLFASHIVEFGLSLQFAQEVHMRKYFVTSRTVFKVPHKVKLKPTLGQTPTLRVEDLFYTLLRTLLHSTAIISITVSSYGKSLYNTTFLRSEAKWQMA